MAATADALGTGVADVLREPMTPAVATLPIATRSARAVTRAATRRRDPRPGGGPDLPLLERPAGVSGDFLSRPIQLGSIAQSYRYVSTSGALGIRSRGRGDDRATIRRLYSFRAAYDAATM